MITGRNLAKIILALASFVLAVPARAAVVDVTGTSTKLGWTAATGAVASYGVFVSKNGAAFPASPNQVVTTPEATVTAAIGETLVVKVAAYDSSGTKGPDSASSDSLHFVAAPGPPPPPDPVPSLPALTLSTTSLTVSATQGTNPPAQSFTVRNSGGGTLGYLTAYSHSWIVLSNSAGTVTTETDTVDVSFASSNLPAGSYTGTITVLHSGTPAMEQYITVHLTVAAPPPAAAAISVSTSSLAASVEKGKDAAAASFTVRNSGGGTLGYAVSESASWLSLSPASGSSTGESDTIGVSYATASLAAGTYTTTITVSGGTGVAAKTLAVSLTVSDLPPAISVSTASLTASVEKGKDAAAASFTVRNSGGGTLGYLTAYSHDWIGLSASSGTATTETDTIGVSFATASLPAGSYRATITVLQSGTPSAERYITVDLTVTEPAAAISLSAASLAASAEKGKDAAAASFTVRNSGGGTLGYAVSESASWLSLSPASGSSTGESDTIGVSYATSSLDAGTYTTTITVSGGTGVAAKTLAVSLTVSDVPPAISLSTTSLSAAVQKGQNPAPASFTVRNTGGGTLGYAVAESASWLSLSPASGSSTGESDTIAVSYATSSLDAGTYTTMLTVSASGVPAKTIAVSVTVSPGTPVLELSTTSVDAAASPGQSPSGQSLTVRNAGAGTLAYAVTSDQSWVTVSPASGSSTGEADPISLTFSTASLAAGTHQATLTVSATGLASRTVSVSLRLASAGVGFDLDGDGSSDALFRHADGSVSGWLMNGAAIRSSVSVPSLGVGWTLAGTGDFDGDGKSFDFLWLQPSSGNVTVALNAGSTQKGLGSVSAVGQGWRVGGVADFDADGKSDVLWIDPATGSATVWLLDRFSLKAVRAIGTIGAGWDVAATADFDGDRKVDVLLERTGSPDLILWLFDGTTVRQTISTAIVLGDGWTVGAVGDFSGDGRTDLAAVNSTFGFLWLLTANGTGFSPTSITGWVAPSSTLAAARDFDANGNQDLVVFDPASGAVSAWLLGEGWFQSIIAMGSLDSSWTVLGEKGTAR